MPETREPGSTPAMGPMPTAAPRMPTRGRNSLMPGSACMLAVMQGRWNQARQRYSRRAGAALPARRAVANTLQRRTSRD
eukprot:6851921-Alexandrium_andersonii.AAC.1